MVKADSFRLHDGQDQPRDSCEPKLCQSVSEGMVKVPLKQGAHTKRRSGSRSGPAGSAEVNITRVPCVTCFTGHLGRRIRS